MLPRLLRALRFFGLLLLNVVVAVIGTAILEAAISKAIPVRTMVAVYWKEVSISLICATLIGFGVWRTWRSEAAKWTWVLPLLWFGFALLAVAGHGIWGPLSVDSVIETNTGQMRTFALFTVPLIRAVAYSIGAYIASFIYLRVAESVH